MDDYILEKRKKRKKKPAAVESVIVSNPDGGLQQQLQDKVLFSTVYYFDLWLHTLKESRRMFFLC